MELEKDFKIGEILLNGEGGTWIHTNWQCVKTMR